MCYAIERERQNKKVCKKQKRLLIEAEINETEAELSVLDPLQNGSADLVQAEPNVDVHNKEVPKPALIKNQARHIRDEQFKEPPAVPSTVEFG